MGHTGGPLMRIKLSVPPQGKRGAVNPEILNINP